MGNIGNVINGLKPAIGMIIVQVAYAGLSILYKLVVEDGMNMSVLIAYRTLFATSFVVPLAFFMERKSKPKITPDVLFQSFLCGLFGVTLQQNLYVRAVAFASATYASTMTNLIPGVTFILALCFGLERLKIRTLTGKAKVIGTIMGIGGVMIITFYKTKEIHIWPTHHVNMIKHNQSHISPTNQVLGSAFGFGNCLCYSMWLILQAKMSEKFPWQYSSAALVSAMACIQVIIFALCMERNWNQWKLGWNIKLLSVAYTGIVASGIALVLISWCVRLRGPLYASTFNPLSLVIVTIAASLILDERLYVGSIIGSILVVLGLYTVLWGKGKEYENMAKEKLTKVVSTNGQTLKIIITTNNHSDNNINNGIDMKLSREGQQQNGVKDCSSNKGNQGNEGKVTPLNNEDSKPST
ncbi:hypothetical protein HN51_053403 [Arachis hypogaea]|uniref:WAT1-related protein n=1 Tax=Arachis hypogaea TaxID=3818 RepID=A0A444XC58_ARAHY|nr:WAT1-related protein At1g68170-like [Arachis ipaensis]XP_025674422.1 WAT1-related protein At1g68170 isoform X1 [Arachis hypogaea]QHN75743.1 WAT1-related protein [Arachis hypogaea]RYQ87295.1 hypothetical protein Ahy_B09g094775 [Arachis hypogaea]